MLNERTCTFYVRQVTYLNARFIRDTLTRTCVQFTVGERLIN